MKKMDFGKFCTLCDFFIRNFNVNEDMAEVYAMQIWDILGCEAADADMIPAYFANLAMMAFQEN